MVLIVAGLSSTLNASGDQAELEVMKAIARDIEKLKPEFPQLADFSTAKNFNVSHRLIEYSFHTHASKRKGGWTAGVPNPDDDGIWFYIDIHDATSTAQIHTQPVTAPICLGDKKVSFLILEGDRTKSRGSALWKILSRNGVKRCSR